MSQEAIFVGIICLFCVLAFLIAGVAEYLFLRQRQWVKEGNLLLYVAASSVAGIIFSISLAMAILGLLLLFGAAVLGGGLWTALAAIVLGLLAIVITPAIVALIRMGVQKMAGISKESLTFKYGLAVSILDVLFVFVFIFVAFSLLTGITSAIS